MAAVLGEVDPGLGRRHCVTGVTVPLLLVLVGVVAPDGGVVVVLVLVARSLDTEDTLTMRGTAPCSTQLTCRFLLFFVWNISAMGTLQQGNFVNNSIHLKIICHRSNLLSTNIIEGFPVCVYRLYFLVNL